MMASRDNATAFLLECIKSTERKPNFNSVGSAFGIKQNAARMRFDRLKKSIEKQKTAHNHVSQSTSADSTPTASEMTEDLTPEPSPYRTRTTRQAYRNKRKRSSSRSRFDERSTGHGSNSPFPDSFEQHEHRPFKKQAREAKTDSPGMEDLSTVVMDRNDMVDSDKSDRSWIDVVASVPTSSGNVVVFSAAEPTQYDAIAQHKSNTTFGKIGTRIDKIGNADLQLTDAERSIENLPVSTVVPKSLAEEDHVDQPHRSEHLAIEDIEPNGVVERSKILPENQYERVQTHFSYLVPGMNTPMKSTLNSYDPTAAVHDETLSSRSNSPRLRLDAIAAYRAAMFNSGADEYWRVPANRGSVTPEDSISNTGTLMSIALKIENVFERVKSWF